MKGICIAPRADAAQKAPPSCARQSVPWQVPPPKRPLLWWHWQLWPAPIIGAVMAPAHCSRMLRACAQPLHAQRDT